MMKKMIAWMLALALLTGGMTASKTFAEEPETTETAVETVDETAEETAEAAENQIKSSIEDGCYVIQIPVTEGDQGWAADDLAEASAVVKLQSEEIKDGKYTAVYAPVGDGEETVTLRHYGAVVCDQLHTFDLRVENGAITENFGGSYTASPAEEELDPVISGEWVEPEQQLDAMTITKNPEGGWNVEIVSAADTPVLFRGTVYFDCEFGQLIYADGEFYETAITDGEEEPELGEPFIRDASGAIGFEGADEEHLQLAWYSWTEEQHPEPVVFARPES